MSAVIVDQSGGHAVDVEVLVEVMVDEVITVDLFAVVETFVAALDAAGADAVGAADAAAVVAVGVADVAVAAAVAINAAAAVGAKFADVESAVAVGHASDGRLDYLAVLRLVDPMIEGFQI